MGQTQGQKGARVLSPTRQNDKTIEIIEKIHFVAILEFNPPPLKILAGLGLGPVTVWFQRKSEEATDYSWHLKIGHYKNFKITKNQDGI